MIIKSPGKSNEIIIGGKPLALGLLDEAPPIVLTWHDHGITFAAGEGYNKKRKHEIDIAVWHWTGGEQEPVQMVETLRARGYGVEFAISSVGVIWQFADPLLVDTADAAGVNARSVGIEMVSYGRTDTKPGWKVPRAGVQRAVRRVLIHGHPVHVASFFPAQIAAARALADGLSRGLHIERRVPTSSDGVVLARQMNVTDLARFGGHIGHYHLTTDKTDPGPDFMAELQQLFRETPASPAGPPAIPPPPLGAA